MSEKVVKKAKVQKSKIFGRIVAGAMIVFMLISSCSAFIFYLINK